ncbi:AfsR/SARP family transcriptional regulator [Allokutzneria albata]|uniref:DNA-binding transcriptional activator of the SARP family n=1 Tax=Allokutzneria albata TaxID=211114 RepID=A0A1H0AWP1_ALLAB|nr:BTAD domain-containing putative transcriptional regulator [Allokutzneria albata]SDN37877.1 DNA-binding transcriptional activator of the SARP family [Allokutzneria albata]
MTIEFRVLGALEVLVDGEVRPVQAAKLRTLLAALLLRAPQPVSPSELMDIMWGEERPPTARNALHIHIGRLRRLLGDDGLISTVAGGYVIRVDEIDLDRFRCLVESARQADEPEEEIRLLREALALWRGQVLSDVVSDSLDNNEIASIKEELLTALEQRVDADLRLGRHREVIAELRALTAEHPLRERFWGQLMVALYRCERQAEALEAFRAASAVLREELDVSPGPELRELHQGVLTGSAAVAAPVAEAAAPAKVVPQQLPADIADFVGRRELIELLVHERPRLAVLSGPPGVGKTALSVRVAHQLKQHFPDGQLFANFHGYSSGTAPSTGQVLARFLRALGVAPEKVPLEVPEQSAMLRDQLAGRKVLMVLDNVANADQVRTFLPEERGCTVLVSSRDTLRELADDGAVLESLDVLAADEAQSLLSDLLGTQRFADDRSSGVELADLCGNLPLALRIAGANLAGQSRTALSEYVRQLRDGDRLAVLAVDEDEQAAVRATFALSYTSLSPELRRFFRALALQPGPDVTVHTAAALAGVAAEHAADLLDRLVSASLVHEHVSGRYQFHDLVRLFAQQQSTVEDAAADRAAARERLFAFYAASSAAAAAMITPELYYLPPVRTGIEVDSLEFTELLDAHAWMEAERANLIAAVVFTADHGPRWVAWHVATYLTSFFRHTRDDADWRLVAEFGLRAAVEENDTRGQAAEMRSLSMLYWCMGDNEKSLEYSTQSLSLYQEVGDRRGQAQVLSNMGVSNAMSGNQAAAVSILTQALALEDELGASRGLANCMLNLGTVYAYIGQVDLAVATFRKSRALAAELNVRHVEGVAGHNLAILDREAGRFAEALEGFERTLAVWRQISSSHDEAAVLDEIAVTELLLGRYGSALANANAALRLSAATGNRLKEVEALNTIASAYVKLGQPERALPVQEEAVRIVGEIGYEHGTVDALIGLAAVQRALGEGAAAVESGRKALACAVDNGLRLCEPRAMTSLAQSHLHVGEAAEAVEHANRALPLHRETRQRVWEAWTVQVLGLACRALGNNVDAVVHLRAAHEMFVEMGMPEANALPV